MNIDVDANRVIGTFKLSFGVGSWSRLLAFFLLVIFLLDQ
jgi:hypothetical protein